MKYFIGIKFHIYQKYLQWKKIRMTSYSLLWFKSLHNTKKPWQWVVGYCYGLGGCGSKCNKKKSNVCHPDFGNKWNEKKTMMTNSVLIMVVLDATTQEKNLGWQT
jgi:hypothetical protein